MKVKCPTCGKLSEYSTTNPVRPFCSERCQTLDLGAWADEKYRVPLNSPFSEQESSTVNEKPETPPHIDELN
jgi:endogenous inhibitor of DNA gyrase (YacG/DUF329 family)